MRGAVRRTHHATHDGRGRRRRGPRAQPCAEPGRGAVRRGGRTGWDQDGVREPSGSCRSTLHTACGQICRDCTARSTTESRSDRTVRPIHGNCVSRTYPPPLSAAGGRLYVTRGNDADRRRGPSGARPRDRLTAGRLYIYRDDVPDQ